MQQLLATTFQPDVRALRKRYRALIRGSHHRGIFPTDRIVIAFRPRRQSSLAITERFRPLGATELIQLRYASGNEPYADSMPVDCYQRRFDNAGLHEYGSVLPQFTKNGFMIPCDAGFGQRMNLRRDPSLALLVLQMHQACLQKLYAQRLLQRRLILPKLWLGFPVGQRPEYEGSLALRQLAAQRLGVPLAKLGANGEVLLNEFLHNLWSEIHLAADHPENNTGLDLIESCYCSQHLGQAPLFEDFRSLRGVPIPNPVWEMGQLLGTIDIEQARAKLPEYWSSVATDADVQLAIDNPQNCLHASLAPRMQVIDAGLAL
jgi:hypothetical protein